MTERHIVAIGGGVSDPDDPVFRHVFELAGASRPRVCYVPTATGDAGEAVAGFYARFPARRFETTHLSLFSRGAEDLRGVVMDQDVVVVAGGSTANLLALWRLHGLDEILRAAWESGVVLTGASAGANCWFEASTTDAFGPELQPLRDGVGLLPGSFCPHYDSEPGRRPLYRRLVAEGFPTGYAADDLAACHFVGTELATVVRSAPSANAYRVGRAADGSVSETPLP